MKLNIYIYTHQGRTYMYIYIYIYIYILLAIINNKSRSFYRVFVNDSLFAVIVSIIMHEIVASIEVLCTIIGFPDLTSRQDLFSLDEYF